MVFLVSDPSYSTKMSDPRIKQIKIKTGVLRRVGKEKLSYRKEADQQKAKIEKMKADGKDEHDIKKMGEVLQETLMMIPDCHRRLGAAHTELKNILETEAELAETEEYEAAKTQIAEAEEQLKVE
jgi:tubulin-specific chaperone A